MISDQRIDRQVVVVVGNGMVGQRFCERLVELDLQRRYRIVTFCEEARSAYDRVGLTSFFAHRSADKLLLARREWYAEQGIELHVGDRAAHIDRRARMVTSERGVAIRYDYVVLATGSFPFVPPVPGVQLPGVFVYRTIEDLQAIIAYAASARRCAVIGGGLLGLEAAKAAYDLKLETHVIERSPRLMPRQIDDAASRILVRQIEALGVHVRLNAATKAIQGSERVECVTFEDGAAIDSDMVIISTGIRPRDELAKVSGLVVGERGGIAVNDRLETSDERILAIGECALHRDIVYGLVAPGYEMAEVVAANLTGEKRRFTGADTSTKLKLMGVDVASFGAHDAPPGRATPLVFEDPIGGIYRKLLFSPDGARLLGGILVGDATDYAHLGMLTRNDVALPGKPFELVMPSSKPTAASGFGALPDTAQVCSCNNVTKQAICSAIHDRGVDTLAKIKQCTKAGTGCGGCVPLVADVLAGELRKAGKSVVNHLCEHLALSRTELFAIVKAKELRTFAEVLAECGRGLGCEVCKPAVASILASLWAEDILEPQHETLQDTNDRFLANLQRGGTYSVVPRVPGGEITPERLAVIARVAQKYGLYTKITGGQRIDMFGAPVEKLPEIWEELVDAGFESGHAYGKAVRTVKSCVGTTWCRYGVQDSVAFAIRVENRYKGIRAPHKIKMAVSGCTRECAEAQSKDVGLIATERGYNLYVCGNGGSKPRHAELLATDVDEDTALRYIDRFLMYYIMTADKLTRTATWVEKLEGGLEHVKDVVIHDKLKIADELDARMAWLVDAYQCEWAAVVRDPERRRWFRQFMNTDEHESCIEVVHERGQVRPADWPGEFVSLEQFRMLDGQTHDAGDREIDLHWVTVGSTDDFPRDGGASIKYGKSQIAVFHLASRDQWYATQNMCPHKKAFVLSRGIVGDAAGEPKVACPLHKRTFSLVTGASLQAEEYRVRTFPVRVVDHDVQVQLPPEDVLDRMLATEIGCRLATACDTRHATAPERDAMAATNPEFLPAT